MAIDQKVKVPEDLELSNPIRRIWNKNNCAIGGWVLGTDPIMAEAVALAGFDWICIDMQHGWIGFETLPKLIQAVSLTGAIPIVRVPANQTWLIGKALDAGAYGVMVPLVNTEQQARDAVAACRYMPAGVRSIGAYRPAPLIANSARQADVEIICIVQIETKEALDNLEAICKVPGLDVVYVGPGDMALSLGLNSKNEIDPVVLLNLRDTAIKHGVQPAMHGESGGEALWAIQNGFRLTTAGADVDYVYIEAKEALAIAKGIKVIDITIHSWLGRVPRIAVSSNPEIH